MEYWDPSQSIPPSMKKIKSQLSEEETQTLDQLLEWEEEKEIVIQCEGYSQIIDRKVLQSLIPGCWVNSRIYNYGLQTLVKTNPSAAALTHSLSRKVISSYTDRELLTASVRTEIVEQFKKSLEGKVNLSKLFIPVGGDNHASLLVIYPRVKQIVHYDTLQNSQRDQKVFNAFLALVSDSKTWDVSEWKTFAAQNIPAQRKSWECVLYCLSFAETLLLHRGKGHPEEFLNVKHSKPLHMRLQIARRLMDVTNQQ